jgi:hypothetical protein
VQLLLVSCVLQLPAAVLLQLLELLVTLLLQPLLVALPVLPPMLLMVGQLTM